MTTLQSLIDQACDENGEVSIRTNYSGRGMYGSECVGITGALSDCMSVISSVITEVARNMVDSEEPDLGEFSDTVDTLLRFKQDSMGRDTILYWPTLTPENTEEDDSEVQDDE